MVPLLPSAETFEAFQSCRQAPLDVWIPALRATAARHGIAAARLGRFERGENPVFNLGDQCVLKFVPPFWATIAERECQCLTHLRPSAVPVAALIASGEQDGWRYVIQEKVSGHLLEDLWATMSPVERQDAAHEVGAILAALHAIPPGTLRPGGVVWSDFVEARIASWATRKDVARLPASLRATGTDYIKSSGVVKQGFAGTLLHGDLAPENCLATLDDGQVRIRAIIDFGNAMVGPPLFDLTAPGIVMGKGDRSLVRALFAGYGSPTITPAMRHELMAHTMLHPMGDLAVALTLVPGLAAAESWDAVAEAFWPT